MNREQPQDVGQRKQAMERAQQLHDEVRRQKADGPARNLKANRHARRAAEAKERRA